MQYQQPVYPPVCMPLQYQLTAYPPVCTSLPMLPTYPPYSAHMPYTGTYLPFDVPVLGQPQYQSMMSDQPQHHALSTQVAQMTLGPPTVQPTQLTTANRPVTRSSIEVPPEQQTDAQPSWDSTLYSTRNQARDSRLRNRNVHHMSQ